MKFITLNDDNIVVAIRYGTDPVQGEIQSEYGELGQIYNPLDNSFEDATTEDNLFVDTGLSMEDKIDYIFYTLKGGIENV